MLSIEDKIKKGYASGFLFLRFVKTPETKDLISSLDLVFKTYENAVNQSDSIGVKSNRLINLLSMYDFIDKADNPIALAAVRNTVEKWIYLLDNANSSTPQILNLMDEM
jgi:hypothetical protein